MDIILSHASALEFWRSREPEYLTSFGSKGILENRMPIPPGKTARLTRSGAHELQNLFDLNLPIHALATSTTHNRRSQHLATHVLTNPPLQATIHPVAPGVHVCSPELCFLQMASSLTLVERIALGFELCGRYSLPHRPGGETKFGRTPLVSKDSLAKFIETQKGCYGANLARAALPYIAENSYSPQESNAAMLFGLPFRLGGYSLGIPEMNRRIDLPDSIKGAYRRNYCECDLYWPNLDLEYDSYAYHVGTRAEADRDAARRLVLEHLGINVLSVTFEQLRNSETCDVIARNIAGHLGHRINPRSSGYPQAKRKLRIFLGYDR